MKIDLSHLPEQAQRALLLSSAAEILGNLADISPGYEDANSLAEGRGFVQHYGPLLPGANDPEIDVLHWAANFRKAWLAKTPSELAEVSQLINEIFSGNIGFDVGTEVRPVLWADFATGRFQPIPHSLLEVLAIELLQSRRRLKRCERPECQRHFVKQHARHRYCSVFCSEDMRVRYLKDWHSRAKEKSERRKSHAKR